MSTTIGDGIVMFSICFGLAFAFVGFFYVISDDNTSDYELCIRKCPKNIIDNTFNGFECPKICEEVLIKQELLIEGETDVKGYYNYYHTGALTSCGDRAEWIKEIIDVEPRNNEMIFRHLATNTNRTLYFEECPIQEKTE